MLYSLHNELALLHKYTSTERQRVTKPPCLVHLSSCLGCASVGRVLVSAARSGVASALEISSGLRGPSHQAFTHLENAGRVWAFPCAWTHLKKSFVPYSSGWWVGRQIPDQTYVFGTLLQLLGHTSAGRGFWSGVPRHWISLWPQGGIPPGFNPPLIDWRLRCPSLGECR